MNNIYQPFQNFQQPGYMQTLSPAPLYEDIKFVNGIEGARNYRMAPNASTLLMDNNSDRIFMVKADASGLTQVTTLTFQIEQPEAQVNANDLLKRIEKLEAMINEQPAENAGKHKSSDAIV